MIHSKMRIIHISWSTQVLSVNIPMLLSDVSMTVERQKLAVEAARRH